MGMAPVTQVLFTRYAVTTVIRASYVHPYSSWFAPIGSSMRTRRVPSGLTVIDSCFQTGQYHVPHYIHYTDTFLLLAMRKSHRCI